VVTWESRALVIAVLKTNIKSGNISTKGAVEMQMVVVELCGVVET